LDIRAVGALMNRYGNLLFSNYAYIFENKTRFGELVNVTSASLQAVVCSVLDNDDIKEEFSGICSTISVIDNSGQNTVSCV